MRVITLLLLMACLCTAKSIKGTWENDSVHLKVSKDSIYILDKGSNKDLHIGYTLGDSKDGIRRLYIIVVNKGKDYDLQVGMPYALVKRSRNILYVKRVECCKGISVKDYHLYPWPKFEEPWWVLKLKT